MNPLQQRLASLRRRLRSVMLIRGLSLLVLALLGSGLVVGWLDWEVHLPAALRAVMLVAILGGAAAVGYLFLLAPFKAKSDDLALALRIEREYPVLNDALASTVQFLEQPEDSTTTGSPMLRREAIQRALRLAQGCDFMRVVNTRGLRVSSAVAATVMGIVALLFLLHPGVVRSATLRLIHPFGEHDWPTQTNLALSYSHRAAAGRSFQIRGDVTGLVPKNAIIRLKDYALADSAPREYPIVPNPDGNGGSFLVKLDLADQRDSFYFSVEANDARSPKKAGTWHKVEVAQPPRLIPVDGIPSPQKVQLSFPAYTGLKSPVTLEPGSMHFDAVEGTWVTMEARADTPLKTAWIHYQPAGSDTPGKRTIVDAAQLGLFGLSNPLTIATTQALVEQAVAPVPVQLDPDRTKLLIHFRPWLSGPHVLHIEDDTGLANDYTFNVQLLADPPPSVALEQPTSNRTLTPNAEVHLEITAHDEKFGLRSVFLEYWRKDKSGQIIDHQFKRVPLFDEEMVKKDLAEGVSDALDRPFESLDPSQWIKPAFVKVKKAWSLEGLAKEGDILVIRAGATDFNDVVAFNTPGYSHEVELTIVGKMEMSISLDKAQGKLQEKLNRLKELQKGALDNIQEVEKKWAEGKPFKENELKKILDKVQDAEQWQKEMQDLIGKEKKDGLLQELDQLEKIIKDNKINSSDIKDNAKLMKSELKKIGKQLDQIAPPLAKIKQQVGDMDATKPPDQTGTKQDLSDTQTKQKQVLKALDDLLKSLDRWARLHELRAEAQAMLEEQTKVKVETEKLDEIADAKDKAWQDKVLDVAERQNQLAIDAQHLLEKIQKIGEQEAEKNPDIAKLLEEALGLAEENRLVPEMKAADEKLRQLLPKYAWQKNQNSSVKTLKMLVEALTEKRENQLDKLIKQQEQAKGGLNEFIEKLQKLEKEIETAKNIADPAQQKQALQKLAEEQQKLLEEAQKKSLELAKLRADEASQDLSKAAKQMEQALQKLQDGADPLDEQKQALEKVKKAHQKLESAKKEAENELAREKLAKIGDQILALKERQDSLMSESERFNKLIMQGGWARQTRIDFFKFGEAQQELGKEAASLAEKLKGAKVFEKILLKASGNMEDATKAIKDRWVSVEKREDLFPFPPKILTEEQQKHATIVKFQKQAAQRLQTLVDAVKEGQKELQAKADEPPDGKGKPDQQPKQEQPKGGLQAQDGIPGLAQLQALKSEQLQINERTAALARVFPDMKNLTPEAQAELQSIHDDQEILFELFQEITAAAMKGEKK